MKNIYKIIFSTLLFLPLSAFASINVDTHTSQYADICSTSGAFVIFNSPASSTDNSISYSTGGYTCPPDLSNVFSLFSQFGGSYIVLEIPTSGTLYDACMASNLLYEDCLPAELSNYSFSVDAEGNIIGLTTINNGIIANSNRVMTSAYGFGVGDVVTYMGSLFTLILASALGLLSLLLPYIIGLLIIIVIVGFIYTAFRFFRT